MIRLKRALLLFILPVALICSTEHQKTEKSVKHESVETHQTEGDHVAEGAHGGGQHADIVDFPVMKDHLIGRNKFELINPFAITHPFEFYIPIWIVPSPDLIQLKDGHTLKGIILSETEHELTVDAIHEEDGHKFIEKTVILKSDIKADGIENIKNMDLSLYKQVIMMWFVAFVMIFGLRRIVPKKGVVTNGKMANMVEILVLYFRDEVIYPNLGEKNGRKFAPLILTLFFFIMLSNLFGLIPGTTTATGSVSVTLGLAVITFLTTQFFANKSYWRHIFAMPGVPLWLLPIMIPVEILGLFTKPFALTIRLFANMTAGHIIILAFLGMIINFKNGWIALGSVPMSAAIYLLEIFVAFLQAYIFALLSAIFIGQAVVEHEEH